MTTLLRACSTTSSRLCPMLNLCAVTVPSRKTMIFIRQFGTRLDLLKHQIVRFDELTRIVNDCFRIIWFAAVDIRGEERGFRKRVHMAPRLFPCDETVEINERNLKARTVIWWPTIRTGKDGHF